MNGLRFWGNCLVVVGAMLNAPILQLDRQGGVSQAVRDSGDQAGGQGQDGDGRESTTLPAWVLSLDGKAMRH